MGGRRQGDREGQGGDRSVLDPVRFRDDIVQLVGASVCTHLDLRCIFKKKVWGPESPNHLCEIPSFTV